jgi:anti-sigma regulatory factor (Ser/Thr protein kinase)
MSDPNRSAVPLGVDIPLGVDVPPAPEAQIELPSQPVFLAPLRAFITAIAERCGFDEATQFQIALAIDEAVANVINHGYGRRPDGRVCLKLWRIAGERRGLQVVIEDEGRQVDPSVIRSRNLDEVRPGGLGVHIIQEVMDHSRWERRSEGGMRLILVKFLGAQGACRPAGDAAAATPGSDGKAAKHQQAVPHTERREFPHEQH